MPSGPQRDPEPRPTVPSPPAPGGDRPDRDGTLPEANVGASGEPAIAGRNGGRASDDTRRTEN